MIIEQNPWSMDKFIIAELVTIGLSIVTSVISHGSEYVWMPLSIALVLSFFFYGNAVYCCKEKDRAFNDYKNQRGNSEQFKNISDRVGMLESRFDNFVKEGGIKPHS